MKLSIVIPAYNCETLIVPTLDALLKQELSDWEAIIINDGSTDSTLAVLEEYAARDPRFRIITTQNAGPAAARNRGIQEARGEYLCFLDSDDLPDPAMYQKLVSLADTHRLEVAVCGYLVENVNKSGSVFTAYSHPSFVAESRVAFSDQLSSLIRAHLMYVVWNKCWRVDFLREHEILFADFRSGEDRLFNFQALPHIQRFGCLEDPLYRYLIRGTDSLANRYIPDRFESSVICRDALLSAYRELALLDRPGEEASIDFQFVKLVMSCFTQLFAKGCLLSRKEKRAEIRRILNDPIVQQAASHSIGGYSVPLNALLRSKNVTLIGWTAKLIWLLQGKLHPLFLRLKRMT